MAKPDTTETAPRWKDRATLLDAIELPKQKLAGKYGTVSGAEMVSALRAINSYSRGSARFKLKIATIHRHMNRSRSTAKRALLGLQSLGLLLIDEDRRTGKRANYYQIAWSMLPDFAPGAMVHSEPSDGSQRTDRWFIRNRPMVHGEPSSLTPSLPFESNSPPTWRTVEAELVELKVDGAVWLVTMLNRSTATAADARAVIAFWKLKQPAWQAGALVNRLRMLADRPTMPVDDGWPTPSDAYHDKANAAAREKQRQRDREKYARWKAEAEADRRRRDEPADQLPSLAETCAQLLTQGRPA